MPWGPPVTGKMTVGELIEKLKTFDPGMAVICSDRVFESDPDPTVDDDSKLGTVVYL